MTKFYRTDAASAQLGQNQENKQDLQSPISNKPIENSLFSVIFLLLLQKLTVSKNSDRRFIKRKKGKK